MNIQKYKRTIRGIVPSRAVALAVKKREHPDSGLLDVLRNSKLVSGSGKTDEEKFVNQWSKIVKLINVNCSGSYIYPYDSWIGRIVHRSRTMVTSVTIDYKTVLESNLRDLLEKLSIVDNDLFYAVETEMVSIIRKLSEKICMSLSSQKNERTSLLLTYFSRFLDAKPENLDEAIQKLLFYNAIFWQSGHWQNGLGRLDLILNDYYEHDLSRGLITRESAKKMIGDMCQILGQDMKAKSRALVGDTGQYILLGGIDQNGVTIENDLTHIFIEIFTELNVPDPKLILRVNDNTSKQIWKESIECIMTGCGSPLLINENRVMNSMIEFGYEKEDVWNFGTSACWEPLVIGKSFDQNNPLLNIPAIDSLTKMMIESDKAYSTFEEFMRDYRPKLQQQVRDCTYDVPFDCSPLYSLFFDDCIEKRKDFSQGGATYSWHGVQVASFPNLINALLNIKSYIFDRQLYTFKQCAEALKKNFVGQDEMLQVLKSNPLKFGSTNKEVIDLTNDIMSTISDMVSTMTLNGEKVKVGFSSSHYIIVSANSPASMDGRKYGDPYAVHLSPVSQKIDIQEVLDFASQLDYSGNRLNGNVVDFILPKAFCEQPRKLSTILRNAFHKGVFELQLNILDAATLKDAKVHPEKYPYLVVRVWGFSAYFNDLPEEYKDHLISRAEAYA